MVTITGTGFVSGDTSVTIGGTLIPKSSVVVNSATSLTFSTPAHIAGNVAVSVATSGGSSNTVPGGFTYPTQSVVPSVNIFGQVLVTAINIPGILTQGLIGCNVQLCSDNSCSVLGGTAGPVNVSFGL